MADEITKLVINSLENQKEIFCDLLYQSLQVNVKKKSSGNKVDMTEETSAQGKIQIPVGEFENSTSLDELNNQIKDCRLCPLGETRTKFVFGAGNPNADIMLIGEAPGAEEDKAGVPFVGRAGKLLNDILKAINLSRDEIYIANILKCRPPKNRDPKPEERDLCMPYLLKQIDLIKPKMILCLGRIAANTLLGTNESLTKLRERVHEFHGVTMMATFHPAALLRNPNWKRPVWEDVQKFRKMYDEKLIAENDNG